MTADWRLLVCWNSVLLLVAHAKAYPALIDQWRVPAPLLYSKVALPLTPDVPKQLIAYPMTVSEKKKNQYRFHHKTRDDFKINQGLPVVEWNGKFII